MQKVIIEHLANGDERLKSIIQQIPFPSVESSASVFHDLTSCIIEQQIHYRSTKRSFQKMLDAAGIDQLTLDNFPTFEEKGLQQTKLSTRKYETIARILDFFEQQHIDWPKLSDEEVRQQLSQIKGIGNWTIDMILLYTLQRPNIFPIDDYHLKLMIGELYAIDPKASLKPQLRTIAEQWAPYRSWAVRYLLDWKVARKKLPL